MPIDEGAGECEDPWDGVDGELVRLLGDAVVDLAVDAAVRVLGPHPGRQKQRACVSWSAVTWTKNIQDPIKHGLLS